MRTAMAPCVLQPPPVAFPPMAMSMPAVVPRTLAAMVVVTPRHLQEVVRDLGMTAMVDFREC